jgi:DNA-binding LytR/AlgR family response regulator
MIKLNNIMNTPTMIKNLPFYPFTNVNKIGLLVNDVIKMYNIHEIIYLEGNRNYTNIITINESILISKTLNKVHLKLPDTFVRVHKSYVLNINLCYYFDLKQRQVMMVNQKIIPVSIRLKKNLEIFVI